VSVEVTSRRVSDIYVIALAGEVEMSNINQVEPYFDAAFDSGERLLIVDLEGLTFMDSRMALSLARNLGRARRAGGDLAVVCLESSVCRLLELLGLKDKLQVCESVEQAASALKDPQSVSDAPSSAKTTL
jgi:anti-anti-sigma factor